jgi:hypothetical protein
MDSTATSDTFFPASGSSPPSDGGQALTSHDAAPFDGQALPPQLIEDLAALLASALVADIRQFPNLAEIQANHDPTVESPRGRNRREAPSGILGAGRKAASGARRQPRS